MDSSTESGWAPPPLCTVTQAVTTSTQAPPTTTTQTLEELSQVKVDDSKPLKLILCVPISYTSIVGSVLMVLFQEFIL